MKSRAGDALRGVAGDRTARRVRNGDDADESAHHHGTQLVKSAFVCERTSCCVYYDYEIQYVRAKINGFVVVMDSHVNANLSVVVWPCAL